MCISSDSCHKKMLLESLNIPLTLCYNALSFSRAGPSSNNMETVGRFFRGITPAGRFTNARMVIRKNFQDLLEQVIEPCCQVSTNTLSLPRETSKDKHLNSIHPLWKSLEKCTIGGVGILKCTYLLCDFYESQREYILHLEVPNELST